VAAADFWSEMTGRFFEAAPYHGYADPLDRVLATSTFVNRSCKVRYPNSPAWSARCSGNVRHASIHSRRL